MYCARGSQHILNAVANYITFLFGLYKSGFVLSYSRWHFDELIYRQGYMWTTIPRVELDIFRHASGADEFPGAWMSMMIE